MMVNPNFVPEIAPGATPYQKLPEDGLMQFVRTITTPIIVWDAHLKITHFNRAAERFTGFAAADMIGRHIDLLLTEGYRRLLSGTKWLPHDDEQPEGVEIPIQDQQGNTRVALWTAVQISSDPSFCDATVALGHDITQRLHYEQQVRQSEASFRLLVESAPEVIFVQTEGRFAYVNQAALEMMGVPVASLLLGKAVIEQFHTDSHDLVQQWLTGLNLERQALPIHEVTLIRADGALMQIEVSGVPFDYQGKHGGLLFARDITERKKAEMSLREAESRLRQQDKMASIGQLAAGIAHEINNPLGFIASNLVSLRKYLERIDSYVSILELEANNFCTEGSLSTIAADRERLKITKVRRDLDNLVKESLDGADRVKKIVNALKSFARSEGPGRRDLADLNDCILSTVSIVHNEIKYVATLKLDLGEIPKVLCNQQQISQVVMNLLVNAAQAIRKQGEIIVQTRHDSDMVSIAVRDTGCGIAEENISRLFDPFYTTKEIGKGTGLGLSISSDIIMKHGGDISVESTPGVGSQFIVRLPVTGPPGRDDGENHL